MTDLGSFMVSCSIGRMYLGRSLCDLGASINLMPLSIFKKSKIGEVQPTHMRLQFADRSIAKLKDKIKDEESYYQLFTAEKFLEEDEPNYILEEVNVVSGEKKFESLDLQTKGEKKTKSSIEEPPELELKPSLNHLKYAYLGGNDTLSIIISTHLDATEEKVLLNILKLHKKANGWTLADIQGISPSIACIKLGGKRVKRAPFSLKGKFQRCMMATFSDFLERSVEIFMDDFSGLGDSFKVCLRSLEDFLEKCEETRLVLNWEKRHFMVREGIVLGHKIFHVGLEVDPGKIDVVIPYGGHFGGQKTAAKVLQSRYFWPTLFQDVRNFVVKCDQCQRTENMSHHDEMPQQPILEIELFDVWGIDFMGPFPQSGGHIYILLAINYVSKMFEAISCMKNDAIIVNKFLKRNIFMRFRTPRALISDEGSHFINRIIAKLLAKYNINHKVATTYYPQTNGQVDVSNKKIKKILEKVVNSSCKD
ncbi:integrase [Cucumis melo var. makuwa]|uniref:Integrase n=1 Tax=Cucumis melo var. makuwa TaxID=1194695 RepID=A0A5D3BCU9_CUCMM|nr:integrase [Cucumis melo var. makuwa]